MKVSPYTLLIHWSMLSALQPSRWRYTWHLAGDCIVLGMLTCSLPAKNWQVLNDMIDGHTTHTVQQICTKRHLIFTVVLVSWPIVALKRKIVHVYHKNRNTKRIVLAVGRDYQSDYRHNIDKEMFWLHGDLFLFPSNSCPHLFLFHDICASAFSSWPGLLVWVKIMWRMFLFIVGSGL